MSIATRILDAVTLRRVVAVLLIGGFANAIFAFLSWLASIGWQMKDVASMRALLLAAVGLAVDAGLIYLALRGLASVLRRYTRNRVVIASEIGIQTYDRTTSREGADGSREGGDDVSGPDDY